QVLNVSKSYGDTRSRTDVVRDCSFTIERSKLTVMIGPSGCGKSTLIRLLAGFEKPTSGTIALNGDPVTGPARDRLVLFQESALYEENRRTNFFVTTDIDEAIFLADRLLIMSNIPTHVRAVLEIDVPRPRTQLDLVENDRANEIKMQALSVLHEEAMKSFSRGSKAAADFVEAYSRRVVKP